jgi:hypothetical protein
MAVAMDPVLSNRKHASVLRRLSLTTGKIRRRLVAFSLMDGNLAGGGRLHGRAGALEKRRFS